jgi:molybdopterin molybdotransferase
MTRSADWLEVADARSRILGDMRQLPTRELPLLDALGHVLAEEVVAPVDLPLWDNSAMDGFAVRAVDVAGASAAAPARLRVVDDLPAGSSPSREIGPGEAARVMTGAPVPAGVDSVIRVEHTDGGTEVGSPNGWVQVLSPADAGRNIRRRA